ncbi:hypothetical protein EV175_003632 [Coemansia sp. RSA 1933]|nr:hypothetical protein EV175_003632 [Coemansia sp. RSA 1933]
MAAATGGYAVMTQSSHLPPSIPSPVDDQRNSEQYIWTPPAVDPNYWMHITKARSMRTGIIAQKQALEKTYERADTQGDMITALKDDIVGRERRLLRYINHYILDYDDVVSPRRRTSVVLGTLSPPLSPELSPSRPLRKPASLSVLLTEEPPIFASGSLPPTPTTRGNSDESFGESKVSVVAESRIPRPISKDTVRETRRASRADTGKRATRVRFAGINADNKPALDSQSFINSYKTNARYAAAAEAAAASPPITAAASTKDLPKAPSSSSSSGGGGGGGIAKMTKGRLIWTGLFGSKNVRRAADEQRPAALSKTQSERDEIRINPRLQTRSSEPALGSFKVPNNQRKSTSGHIH